MMSHEDFTTQPHTIGISKSPLKFLLLVFVLSVPFWLVGFLDLPKMLPINLPISALQFVCPITTALILVHKENKPNGMKDLLKRAFDFKRIKNKIWYVPILLLMPAVMILSYGMMRLLEMPLPEPHIPFKSIPIFFLMFFIGAIGEEIGWSGYITDPLQDRWGASGASIFLGAVWAVWHIVPWFQGHSKKLIIFNPLIWGVDSEYKYWSFFHVEYVLGY
ncbi:type II CAAX endopeptidase family protein [Argonema galeatum]|uniref:type II CAAX endopeptidase family protein n=1 Tax=Argonema galeatum TaxID=2942762 RepID=UPI002012BA9D|nr:type II CAAX endopeptidase family protein [Argonema galeatum]MCL1466871.1 CPBP family intramembrane metalloprotease [Argonema galeatum A003/A1]